MNKTIIVFAFVLLILPSFTNAYTEDNGVQEGDVVDMDFEGTKRVDGEFFQTRVRQNMEIGPDGGLIKGFWKGVLGMKVGDGKTISVSPEDGYTNPNTAPVGLYGEILIFHVNLFAIVENNNGGKSSGNLSGTIGTLLKVLGGIVLTTFVIIGIYGLRSKAIATDCVHCISMGRKNINAEGKCSKCGQAYCRASFSRGCPNCKGNSFIPN